MTFFDIYIFIITFCKGWGLSSTNKIYILAFSLGCLILFQKVFSEKFSKKELAPLIIILMVGVLNFIIGKDTTLLFTAITLWGTKNINFKKTFTIIFTTRVITFLLKLIASTVRSRRLCI